MTEVSDIALKICCVLYTYRRGELSTELEDGITNAVSQQKRVKCWIKLLEFNTIYDEFSYWSIEYSESNILCLLS